ncbi:MAG: hypothetical protein ACI4C7_06900 [Clostridia bacterium]
MASIVTTGVISGCSFNPFNNVGVCIYGSPPDMPIMPASKNLNVTPTPDIQPFIALKIKSEDKKNE